MHLAPVVTEGTKAAILSLHDKQKNQLLLGSYAGVKNPRFINLAKFMKSYVGMVDVV